MKENNYKVVEKYGWESRYDKKFLKNDDEEELLDEEFPNLSEDEDGFEEVEEAKYFI